MHITNTNCCFAWILSKELRTVKRFPENSVTLFGMMTGGGKLINEKLLRSRDKERSNGDPIAEPNLVLLHKIDLFPFLIKPARPASLYFE
jgi:hypothetical protein